MQISLILSKTRISEKLSDCLVFCRNILAIRQLTTRQLSAYCLDGLLMKGLIVECVQDCIADTLTYNYQMKGILTTGMACVGRILKTGICVLQH